MRRGSEWEMRAEEEERSSPGLHGVLKDNVGCRGLLQRRPCEPNWLRRNWPGAQIAAPGSWEEQTGGGGGKVSVRRE